MQRSNVARLAALAAASTGLLITLSSGCTHEDAAAPAGDPASIDYPTLAALYGGQRGIYAGCGPNNNVCHNSKQYPDLSTLGAILDDIDMPCNQLVEKPERMHDLCERTGDSFVVAGGMAVEIGYIAAMDPLHFRVELAAPFGGMPADAIDVSIERGGDVVGYLYAVGIDVDPSNPRGVLVTLPPIAAAGTPDDPSVAMSALLSKAGNPADPASIQLGDPNRNGTFGATLGGRLIKPGDANRSFIIRRLTDPAAGPLMPLANCCHFGKTAIRAMWCWISGLSADGSNALDPIAYTSCPAGPVTDYLDYPEPGDGCEASGKCPIQSKLPSSSDPTWSNVHDDIMARRCAGSGCHFDSGGSIVSFAGADAAYAELIQRGLVVPGDSKSSPLYQRLTMPCAPGDACGRMPLGRDPLPSPEIDTIRAWIDLGAPR